MGRRARHRVIWAVAALAMLTSGVVAAGQATTYRPQQPAAYRGDNSAPTSPVFGVSQRNAPGPARAAFNGLTPNTPMREIRPFGAAPGNSFHAANPSRASYTGQPGQVRPVDHWESQPEVWSDESWSTESRYAGSTVGLNDYHMPDRWITGVDGQRVNPNREPRWRDARPVPWESLSYGEYIGPPRTPHLPEYRVLIGDQIDFIFRRKRSLTPSAYRFGIGDVLAVSALSVDEFQEFEQTIQLDGTIQVRGIGSVMAVNKTIAELQADINRLAVEVGGIKESPEVMVKPVNTETNLQDLIRTVDATAGLGGLSRSVIVSPDGTIQLPGIGVLPALGLSLTELQNEANARYREEVDGLEVTALLTARAPRFVFVMGEVRQAGRIELTGPTTLMQAIAQANGWGSGANLRHIVVLRRDKNWQLVATKVDLSGALWGHRPNPSDDMWLRHSDIILVPKNPGQRLADFIEVYFGRGLYGIFPTQGFAVNFDGVSRL